MKGKQWIKIESRYVTYDIKINRNITVITGESGTGKTSLKKVLQRFIETGGKIGVKITASCNYKVMSNAWEDFKNNVLATRNSIILIDEGAAYIRSKDFAKIVNKSSNYFVILTRAPLPNLAYSYKEVYELISEKRGTRYYTSNTPLYKVATPKEIPDAILTEDVGSGHDMLVALFGDTVLNTVDSSKTHINAYIEKYSVDRKLLILADGAAFGPEISKVYNKLQDTAFMFDLWLPESFEELLLTSRIVTRGDVDEILQDPASQIASELFPSWERFYTWLVCDITKNKSYMAYSKSRLPKWYMTENNLEKFKAILPEVLKRLITN